jgi:hypothetical protein
MADPMPAKSWLKEKAILINVHLINAAVFEQLTGLEPPPTPISAATYAENGFPLYKSNENPTIRVGKLKELKTMAQLQDEGTAEEEKDMEFSLITLPDFKPSFIPVSELEEKVKQVRFSDEE